MSEIDPNHPWVEASLAASPMPVPTAAKIEPVAVPGDNGTKTEAAMLTIVDITGVKTVFLNPEHLEALLEQANAVVGYWARSKAKSPIIVADKGMQKVAENRRNAALTAEAMIRNAKKGKA